MKITQKRVESIRECIFDCIDDWTSKRRGPFSWVDDGLEFYDEIGQDIAYKIHWEWVGAWNDTGGWLNMADFLRDWATNDNIRAAIEGKEEKKNV